MKCGKPSPKTWLCSACFAKDHPKKGRPVGVSGIRGIAWHEAHQTWRVVFYENGKQVYHGEFKEIGEWAKARNWRSCVTVRAVTPPPGGRGGNEHTARARAAWRWWDVRMSTPLGNARWQEH